MREEPKKPGRGCLFYGTLIGLVLMLIVVLGGLAGLHMAKKMVKDFTDPAPATLPVVQMSPEKLAAIRKRVDDFREAVRAHKPTEPLKLTSDELNALLNFDADLQPLKGKIYVEMKGNDLGAQLSIPMADIGLEAFRGRYLNGHGKFAISLKYGALKVLAQDLNVKGQPVPDIYMNTIRKQNLAKGFNTNPRASVALDWIQDIQVKDSQLVIIPKESQ
jgi:tetrahydromethanopterin S-methyltransferase subunit G